MKKYKLSPWYDGSVKPVHKGVYISDYVQSEEEPYYRYFNNGKWFIGSYNLFLAEFETQVSPQQNWPWRGILK